MTDAKHIKLIAQRLAALEAELASLRRDLEVLLGEPAPRTRANPQLGSAAKLRLQRQQARNARLSKPIGQGQGAVSAAARRKMELDAKKGKV